MALLGDSEGGSLIVPPSLRVTLSVNSVSRVSVGTSSQLAP